MSNVTKQDLDQLEERLSGQIKDQGIELRKEIKDQGVQLRKEIKDQGIELRKEIKDQGIELRKEIKDQGVQLRKEIKDQGIELRKEIKESADSVLAVVNTMAEVMSDQFLKIEKRFDDLRLDISMIKREINNLNNDIAVRLKENQLQKMKQRPWLLGSVDSRAGSIRSLKKLALN